MQMQLGHRVAQQVVVPFRQLFMEMRHRETAVERTIKPEHPLNLDHRRPTWRRRQAPIVQTRRSAVAMPITPAAERPLADPKQLSRLHLTELRPLRTAQDVLKTHPTYALVNACPIHENPHARRPS